MAISIFRFAFASLAVEAERNFTPWSCETVLRVEPLSFATPVLTAVACIYPSKIHHSMTWLRRRCFSAFSNGVTGDGVSDAQIRVHYGLLN